MKNFFYNICIVIFTSTILICGGCKKNTGVIRIGVILPLSGEVATYGQSVKKGLDLALQNELPNKFKLIYEDSRGEKKTSISALEKLFFSKITFFIGDATSTVTYEIGPRIQSKNGILLVPIATGDKIREIGENVFMISPRNEKQTKKIVDFIKNHFKDRNVGCFFKQNDYGVNIANTFFKLFENQIYSQAYQEGQNDFRTLLIKFKSEGVDLVFLPGNYEETSTILKQAREIKYNAVFIGTDGAYSYNLIKDARDAAEGFFLTMMPVDYNSRMYLEFEEIYKKEHDSKPDIFSCYGYETAKIFIEALKNSDKASTQEVKDYLKTHEFNSLTGILRFDEYGEAIRDFQIYIVNKGEFIPYKY